MSVPFGSVLWLLIAAVTLAESSTDIYVPSLPEIVRFFQSSEQSVSYTLGINLLGLAVSGPVYGVLSDRYGRKKVLCVGLVIYIASTVLCAMAWSLPSLIVGRGLQGVGEGVAYVVSIAALSDKVSGIQFAKAMSVLHLAVAFAPGLAPVVGAYVALHYGWQMIFWIMVGAGMLVLLGFLFAFQETLPLERRQRLSLKEVMRKYGIVLRNRVFLGYTFISSISFAAIWAYLSGGAFYVMQVLGVSPESFAYLQILLVLSYMVGTVLNQRFVERFGVRTLLMGSILLSLFGASGLVATAFLNPDSLWFIYGSLCFFSVGLGFIFANATTLAMEKIKDSRGVAASVFGGLELVCPSVIVAVVGWTYSGTLLSFAVPLFVCCLLALVGGLWTQNLERKAQKNEG
ncbi:MAG: multidrug effflux MFS transporter [bacterium]|nr:multidrug effflux MFS transporter [bacterium]